MFGNVDEKMDFQCVYCFNDANINIYEVKFFQLLTEFKEEEFSI